MIEAGSIRRERRELQQLLRRLLRGPVQLLQRQEGKEISVADDDGRQYPADLVRRAVSRGLVHEADGILSATGQAGAFLRRSLLQEDDAFGEQHRITTPDSVEIAGLRQTVRRNLAESPLSLLSRLKDRAGQPFLPQDALDAGERLLSDFTRAQLQPRITASWEPRLASRAKGHAGGQAEIADTAVAARQRFGKAVDAMGPELAGVAVDVCCFAKGLETVERERQWPVRSAKLMLRTALLALARHYAPPPAGERRTRHHWGAADYRPPISR
jgi:hypothetical protein